MNGIKYIIHLSQELPEKTQSVFVDRLIISNDDTMINDDDIYILSSVELPLDKSFKLDFFNAGWSIRKRAVDQTKDKISFSDPASWECVMNAYTEMAYSINKDIHALCKDAYLSVNLSFGDFCLLYFGEDAEYNKVLNCVKDILDCSIPENNGVWEADEGIINVKKQIQHRASNQHIYKNTNINELLKSAFSSDVDNTDRAWEILRQGSVFLYTFLEEAYRIWYKPNGEPRHNIYQMENDVRAVTSTFSKYYNTFLSQISDQSMQQDVVWSALFLSDAMLSSVAGQSLALNKYEHDYFYNDFYGFIPIVDRNNKTMQSFYCDQFGLLYSIGFLTLPYRNTFDIWGMLPAFVHEFSHYISTTNRIERNEFVLKLVFSSAALPLIDHAEEKVNKLDVNAFANTLGEELLKKYNQWLKWMSPNRDYNRKMRDSMFFLNETFNMFDIVDFEMLYDSAVSSESIQKYNIGEIPSEVKADCITRWNKINTPMLLTFTMALREIRSDMAMCIFLNIGLKEYITIMAKEYNWADYSWKQTADSVIIRFGFMTRYLFYLSHKEKDLYKGWTRKDFNLSWRKEIFKLFDEIESESDRRKELENMRGYIERYIDMNLDREMQDGSSSVVSIFEEGLFFMPLNDEGSEDAYILSEWHKEFKKIKEKGPMIEQLCKCYQYSELNKKNRILLNYKTRLILRDLFMFFPNIDR